MADCLFCKIVSKEAPAEIVHEDGHLMAFNDINPQAKTHILVVPKKHIDSIMALETEDALEVTQLILAAKKIAEEKGLEGYKLQFHVGEKGGQVIFHLHLHLLSDA
jgi:histidine triad (HIT) family protein